MTSFLGDSNPKKPIPTPPPGVSAPLIERRRLWGRTQRRIAAAVNRLIPRVARRRVLLVTLAHIGVFSLVYWIAFALRFDFQIPPKYVVRFASTLPLVLLIKLPIFFFLGNFHGWWRYVTFADLIALLKATAISLVLIALGNHYLLPERVPWAVVLTDSLNSVLVLGALRSSWRLCREQLIMGRRDRRLALMVCTDHSSAVWAHHIDAHPELNYRVVGFLDENPTHLGTRIGGIPIIGTLSNVCELIGSCKATDVLVTADALNGKALRRLMDDCDACGVNLKIIPSMANHLSGSRILPVRDVEINDLLRREPVELDLQSIARDISGQTIMVTGGGGSIGSEICRQLLQFHPRRLIIVDNGENALFLINNELTSRASHPEIIPCVADILDVERLESLFHAYSPAFVFHAAAHKHVGMMELNVGECVKNNVFGTKHVADLAHAHGAAKFVLISTDKAVNPASVMGASKQLAERYIHAMAQESHTAFVVVRFGNVLGSNGSVVPIFREQIRQGGPVTITDERMTRFFMTIPEASQLVLQAAAMGKGGEIFVLEMGEQIRIVDLARDLIRLSGFTEQSIGIEFIGMRPGEKLYEELYFEQEEALETSHPKLRAAYHRPYSVEEVLKSIGSLQLCLNRPDDVVRAELKRIIPEYHFPVRIADTPDSAELDVVPQDKIAG
ncbi:MAG: polysaccharide biosynthesis protein [Planctomycetales bacterium]|nr:polysaccharide biosynthesis protein [Planctomycetales bacterium]